MASKRVIYAGSVDELAVALQQFCTKGPSVCKYGDESKLTAKCALIVKGPEGVEGHHKLLSTLHELQPNLSFAKKVMEAALEKLLELEIEKNSKVDRKTWVNKLSTTEKSDWVQTMLARIRNMARVVSQGQLKSATAKWVKELPWVKAAADGEVDGANDCEQECEEGGEEEAKVVDEVVEEELVQK